MSLVDDYKSGYKAADWGSAPIYPNAVWPQRIALMTPSIDGLTFEIYARNNRRSTERLFSVPFTTEIEQGNVVLYPKAPGDDTGDAFLNPNLWITCQFTEDSTDDVYIVIEGLVDVGVGQI